MVLNLSGTSGITGAGIGTIGPSGANVTGVVTCTSVVSSGEVTIPTWVVHSGDTNTKFGFEGPDTITAETAGSEAARIDSSQRLLIGHTSSHADLHGKIQIAGAASQSLDVARYTANAHPPYINLYKSRNASTGGNTIVNDDDTVGYISAAGNDGSGFHSAAGIGFRIDGTPGDNDMPGRIDFETVPDGGTTLTNRLSIQSGGDVKVVTGNVIIGTSGKGIDFSATSDTSATGASMSSELLDDYEEGTFALAATSDATMSSSTGTYTKIGRLVSVKFSFQINQINSGSTTHLTGLPFTALEQGYGQHGYFASVGNFNSISPYATGNTVYFNVINTNNSFAQNPSILGNSSRVDGSIVYTTST